MRSWPLLVLAAPASAEVWSRWVGIAQKTGFGLVPPLPGIWPSLHLDTAITLPVGVGAYAAYALRAWLAREAWISGRTRRFAMWSAIFSFALGMAGQVAYHLLAQAGAARAPWPVTTLVSCLPVLVLGMGTALAHMLRADAHTTTGGPDHARTAGPAAPWSAGWSAGGRVLFETAYVCDARASEVCRMYVEDLDLRPDDEHARVHGKGGTVRTVLLDDRGYVALLRLYLARSGYTAGPLFRASINGRDGPLSYDAAHSRWKKYCAAAGAGIGIHQLAPYSPH